MNHTYMSIQMTDTATSYLNDVNPDNVFAAIHFGRGIDMTSHDPEYCRAVAQRWFEAAELLEAHQARQAGQS